MFTGEATSPEFELDGQATITFVAGSIRPATNPVISLSATGSATLSGTQASLDYKMTQYRVNITGTGKVKVTFSSNAKAFFLDEVRIMPVTATGIDGVTVQPDAAGKPADRRIYSIDGRYVGTDATQLPKGMYIRGGKKFIKR